MTTNELDTEYTQNILCPYCGSEDIDSWEESPRIYDGSLGIIECGNCDKKFKASRNMEITYTTEKLEREK